MRTFLLVLSMAAALTVAAQSDTLAVRVKHGDGCNDRVMLGTMKELPRHAATITAHDGSSATYEGAYLKEVLGRACPSIAAIEKRVMVRSAVRVDALDGYSALVALTEADTSFREQPILLAWLKNGEPLDGHDGPFQLIVPDDRRHARDVRQVNSLEVITP